MHAVIPKVTIYQRSLFPVILLKKAPGTLHQRCSLQLPTAHKPNTCDVATIDASNSSSGYIIVNYHGSNQKVKLQITGPDGVTYTFDLHGGNEVFPLVSSSGSYTVTVFENVEGTQYATVLSQVISVSIADEFGPYLYPNQYVNFTADSLAVRKAAHWRTTAAAILRSLESVYNYIISNFKYDYDKAKNVKSGYLPDVARSLPKIPVYALTMRQSWPLC